ncbi:MULTISPECIES: ABC transporter substrate-binding protein [unclassified Streptomyces]|uniref:ABC transporter substrate-binding protein n=1 Tax=unclassified Streptomyces TaxID=2593676 RepID=UPI003631EA51
MVRFKHFVAASAALATLGTLAACAPDSGAENGARGGVFTTVDANNPITPGAPMNPYNANGNSFVSFNTMRLGWDKKNPLDPNDNFPGLAKSWEMKGDSLIVHLQDGAKWSDGTPVTLDDLRLSMALGYTQSAAAVGARGLTEGLNVTSVESAGAGAFEFKQAPGTKNVTFTKQVLGQVIVNAKVYGHLVPADMWDIIHASQQVDPAKAKAAKAANSKLTGIGKQVSAFAPQKDISAGPFVVRKLNPGSVILDKNKNFYAARKVGPSQVVVRHYSGNEQIWGFMKNGELDAAPFTAIPENVLKQIESKGYRRTESVSYVQASLAFNQSRAPYDKKEVRQGLAYLLDRAAATKVGQPVGGETAAAPTGMVGQMTQAWLTKDQSSALEPYAHDTAKAEALFRKAGLTKKGGKWYLANGKQWKMTLQTVNGFSDWISASTVIANQLSSAGIDTKPQLSADFGKYQEDMAAEKFDVGWWLTAVGSTARGDFQRLYGESDGFTANGDKVSHTDKKGSGNWMHGPVNVTVGGKRVNPGDLTAQLAGLDNESAKPIIDQLAQVTAQEVPVIPIWDYTNVKFYSERNFTNFPKNGQDELLGNFPGMWMAQGYIQPKK